MIQFNKKLIGNLNMSSTKIHCKLVKIIKKNINFQYNFNVTSTQPQHKYREVLFNQYNKLLSFYYILL